MRCDGKVVIVLGASRGIGLACAERLAAEGATVVPTTRAEVDVRDRASVESAVDAAVERFGRVDALVANAGVNPHFVRPEELTEEMWDEIVDVNLRGIFFAIQAVAKRMLEAGEGGSIVAVSSATAARGTKRGMPYVATKGGLDAATRPSPSTGPAPGSASTALPRATSRRT